MTATDELRRMLDERGVEWWSEDDQEEPAYYFVTKWFANAQEQTYEEIPAIRSKSLKAFCVSPEQAIAATLGRRDCKLRDCEGSFSAVNRPVWLCDCGAFMTQYTDATTYHKPNYCPNCGARIERREQ